MYVGVLVCMVLESYAVLSTLLYMHKAARGYILFFFACVYVYVCVPLPVVWLHNPIGGVVQPDYLAWMIYCTVLAGLCNQTSTVLYT